MHTYIKFLGIAGTIFLICIIALSAKKGNKKTPTSITKLIEARNKDKINTDINVRELIKRSSTIIGNLETYRFEAIIVNEDYFDGHRMIYSSHRYKVSVAVSDETHIEVIGDVENKNIYFNNNTEALDNLTNTYGIPIPLIQFLYSDLDEDINVSTKEYYHGTVMIKGTPCYYIALRGKEWDADVWIEKDGKLLIRKILFVDKIKKGHPASILTFKGHTVSTINVKVPEDT